jgi:hypothetical protein
MKTSSLPTSNINRKTYKNVQTKIEITFACVWTKIGKEKYSKIIIS